MRSALTVRHVRGVPPWQANQRIIDSAADRLGVPAENVVSNIADYGNTSAASIPLALDEWVRADKVKDGDIVCPLAYTTHPPPRELASHANHSQIPFIPGVIAVSPLEMTPVPDAPAPRPLSLSLKLHCSESAAVARPQPPSIEPAITPPMPLMPLGVELDIKHRSALRTHDLSLEREGGSHSGKPSSSRDAGSDGGLWRGADVGLGHH